jgi:hypothetical protein
MAGAVTDEQIERHDDDRCHGEQRSITRYGHRPIRCAVHPAWDQAHRRVCMMILGGSHPGASRDVLVSETTMPNRLTQACAHGLSAVVHEVTEGVGPAHHGVSLELMRRFSTVIIEESRSRALPEELAAIWRDGGGPVGQGHAAIQTRWERTRGQMWGQSVMDGRPSDRSRPFTDEHLPEGRVFTADRGSVTLDWMGERRSVTSDTLTHPPSSPAFGPTEGTRLPLTSVLPQRGGQTTDMPVGLAPHSVIRCAC